MTLPTQLGSAPSPPREAAAAAAERIARQLADPAHTDPSASQSLTAGAAGIALLHIERAHASLGTWTTAHRWLQAATQHALNTHVDCGLYLGAPAVAFALHAAAADGSDRYGQERAHIDAAIQNLAHRKVDHAQARQNASLPLRFAEYDLLRGLSGLGVLLMMRAPHSNAMERVLTYLVELTTPIDLDGRTMPGWFVHHGPRMETAAGSGHLNLGLAHGITGPLAILAQARHRQITVDGQQQAIQTICSELDTWRQDGPKGTWWPQWVTLDNLASGDRRQPFQRAPGRPSWCYGTPGIARVQQRLGILTGDQERRRIAEDALSDCLSDRVQLGRVIDDGLCHGWAGLYQVATRAAQDASTTAIAAYLTGIATHLTEHAEDRFDRVGQQDGFLEGTAGLALALHAVAFPRPPLSGWDSCLMIT